MMFGVFNGVLLRSLTASRGENGKNHAIIGGAGASTAAIFAFVFLDRAYLQLSPVMLGTIFGEICLGCLYLLVKNRRIIIS